MIKIDVHVNDPDFATAIVGNLHEIHASDGGGA